MTYLAPLVTLVAALFLGGIASPAAAQIRTEGGCSPVFEQSQVTGHVTIICGAGRKDLAQIVERVNRLIDESRLNRAQVVELIQVLNRYGDARVGRNRLGAVMTTYLSSILQDLFPADRTPIYVALADPSDKRFGGNGDEQITYRFIAMRDDNDESEEGACRINDHALIAEIRITASRRPSDRTQIKSAIIAPSDPLLQRLCHGLRGPIGSITPASVGSVGGRSRSIFDYLAADQPGFVLTVLPGARNGIRVDEIRTTWTQAFIARSIGTTPALDLGPQGYVASADVLDPDSDVAPGSGITADVVGLTREFEGVTLEHPYPSSILSEFNPELQKMDAAWLRYTANRSVMVRGAPVKLVDQGQPRPVLQMFSYDAMGSIGFWVAIKDPMTVLRQEACMAARFAIENGYVAVGDLPDYSNCGTTTIYAD